MEKTLILLHGYGVRGWFWDGFTDFFKKPAGGSFGRVLAPDQDMRNISVLIESTERLVREEAERNGGVTLVGHSMGGAVAAVVAASLGDTMVRKFACLATPFGENRSSMSGLVKFLIRHRLIPDFVARPQFFSSHTPLTTQKSMFEKVVPESVELQEAIMADNHFHTALLTHPAGQPAMVVCSEADRVVPFSQSQALAAKLAARLEVFPKAEHVGHNDMVAAPKIVTRTQAMLGDFFSERYS